MNGLVLALLLAVAQSAVVPASLSQPAYPTIAAAARIAGEVEVVIQVRSDGSIESAKVISGNPLLSEAALEAAKSSKFECRRCTQATTPYSIVFEFQFDDALKAVAAGERPDGSSSQSPTRTSVDGHARRDVFGCGRVVSADVFAGGLLVRIQPEEPAFARLRRASARQAQSLLPGLRVISMRRLSRRSA